MARPIPTQQPVHTTVNYANTSYGAYPGLASTPARPTVATPLSTGATSFTYQQQPQFPSQGAAPNNAYSQPYQTSNITLAQNQTYPRPLVPQPTNVQTGSNKVEPSLSVTRPQQDTYDPAQSPIPMPDIPKSFKELDNLTMPQLEKYLKDDITLEVSHFSKPQLFYCR
jgi:hypothetical protein